MAKNIDAGRLSVRLHRTVFQKSVILFELGLTGHRNERFLLKIEAQNQGVIYPIETKHVQRCGFFFSLPTPPDSVLLSMKLSALLARVKGPTTTNDSFDNNAKKNAVRDKKVRTAHNFIRPTQYYLRE